MNSAIKVDRRASRVRPGAHALSHVLSSESVLGHLFVAPLLVLLFGLIGYPFVSAIGTSLTDKMIGYPSRFVGFDNFIEALAEPAFQRSVLNVMVYAGVSLVFKFALGMGMALLLNSRIRGRSFFRGVLLLPWIMPTVICALIWFCMLNDMRGVVNQILLSLGLIREPISWLAKSSTALLSVTYVNIWKGFPFFGVCFLAALQTVPHELYEAASIDGASPWGQFLNVTMPCIKETLVLTVILSTIWTMNDFQLIYILTKGGPGYSTQIPATLTYEIGVEGGFLGRGLAISMLFFPLQLLIILGAYYLIGRERAAHGN